MTTARLECDGEACVAMRQGQPGEPIGGLRARLADVGWKSRGDRDVCPTCLARGVRA